MHKFLCILVLKMFLMGCRGRGHDVSISKILATALVLLLLI